VGVAATAVDEGATAIAWAVIVLDVGLLAVLAVLFTRFGR
jgi:hypothetical protein